MFDSQCLVPEDRLLKCLFLIGEYGDVTTQLETICEMSSDLYVLASGLFLLSQ